MSKTHSLYAPQQHPNKRHILTDFFSLLNCTYIILYIYRYISIYIIKFIMEWYYLSRWWSSSSCTTFAFWPCSSRNVSIRNSHTIVGDIVVRLDQKDEPTIDNRQPSTDNRQPTIETLPSMPSGECKRIMSINCLFWACAQFFSIQSN